MEWLPWVRRRAEVERLATLVREMERLVRVVEALADLAAASYRKDGDAVPPVFQRGSQHEGTSLSYLTPGARPAGPRHARSRRSRTLRPAG